MYRFITEHKAETPNILGRYVDGWTITQGQGAWKGTTERTDVIDVVGIEHDKAVEICEAIKLENRQEAVLLQYIERESEFI